MSVLTGFEFKAKYSNTKFYKLTNESEIHNGFHYVDGLNIDTEKFNPSDQCSSGGLYFTELNKIAMWISYGGENMTYVREVEILDDSLVYIEENKFKADKFYLHPKVSLKNFEQWNNLEFCSTLEASHLNKLKALHLSKLKALLLSKLEASHLSKLKDLLWYKLAVQQCIKKQTEEIYKSVVQENGFALQCVKEQTEEICKLAVQQNGHALYHVKKQTEEICKLAVQQDCFALQYVKKQTKDLCKLAVRQNGDALHYVNLSWKIYIYFNYCYLQ